MESILSMTAEQGAEAGKSLSFEKVWATLDRISKEADKRQEETDKAIKELVAAYKEDDKQPEKVDKWQEDADKRQKEAEKRQQELDKSIKELVDERKKAEKRQEELNKQMRETDRKISKLGGGLWDMIDSIVINDIVDKFRELGFIFTITYHENIIRDEKNQIFADIDAGLENNDKVILIKVKSKPTNNDVDEHIEQIEKVRRHADLHGDRRKLLGAIVGMVIRDDVRKYILEHGFYVIISAEDTLDIIEPKGEYQPREW
ncbi:MAG: hypothetical protein LBL06_03900 [Treponema sp.]|jgi:vacuolar-type H+-ATPase subunit I/STV1|nr:hypothetical protein [Treponema sp.]